MVYSYRANSNNRGQSQLSLSRKGCSGRSRGGSSGSKEPPYTKCLWLSEVGSGLNPDSPLGCTNVCPRYAAMPLIATSNSQDSEQTNGDVPQAGTTKFTFILTYTH